MDSYATYLTIMMDDITMSLQPFIVVNPVFARM